MKKKSSESFPPERLVRMTSEDIRNKPLTEERKSMLRELKARQDAGDDSRIDYSDIPRFTDEQLSEFQRRPAKKLTTVRLDADVYDWLQSLGGEYTTRINGILRSVMLQRQRR
jgi:uncharacterized protein (DUF4415 family)